MRNVVIFARIPPTLTGREVEVAERNAAIQVLPLGRIRL